MLALKGQKLKDMLEVYRAAGAPNLTNIKKSDRVGEIRQALSDAVDIFNFWYDKGIVTPSIGEDALSERITV